MLCGCASDETMSRFLVPPEKYVLYSCPELATASQKNVSRQHELEALMAKAGSGSGGCGGRAEASGHRVLHGET